MGSYRVVESAIADYAEAGWGPSVRYRCQISLLLDARADAVCLKSRQPRGSGARRLRGWMDGSKVPFLTSAGQFGDCSGTYFHYLAARCRMGYAPTRFENRLNG
jgi:hypothetical protein